MLALNVAAIFAWPWLAPPALRALDPLYSWLCHRQPQRCWVLHGEPMPVCARCLGLWLGLAAMAAFAVASGPWRLRTGLLLLALLVVSWVVGRWLPETWHAERTLAGFAGGLGLYVVAARGWATGRRSWRRVRRGF